VKCSENRGKDPSKPCSKLRYDSPTIYATRAEGKYLDTPWYEFPSEQQIEELDEIPLQMHKLAERDQAYVIEGSLEDWDYREADETEVEQMRRRELE